MRNKNGLSRDIPESIALEVRRRSKFGCVVCRSAIYTYEHIDPEFADATVHDPENICLLCGGCHGRVTRNRLSKATIKARYAEVQQATEIRRPYEELDLSARDISIEIGQAKFEDTSHLIRINGRDLLSLSPPTDEAAFPTLNGVFCDRYSREIFRIIDNVWEGPTDVWDIQVIGRVVTIKTEGRRVALAFEICPPNKIVVKTLDMFLENCHILCDKHGLCVGQVSGARYLYYCVSGFQCRGAEVGIDVDTRTSPTPIFKGLRFAGGEGVSLEGTGIRLGVGAASMNTGIPSVWVR